MTDPMPDPATVDGRRKPRGAIDNHPLGSLWRSMLRRCYSTSAHGYENYGGRGIQVCSAWRSSFWQFVDDLPPRPSPSHTLDRIDNDGDYEPGNVRWATNSEQARNTRFNRLLTVNGVTRTAEDWIEITGIPKSTLFNRLDRGWDDQRAVCEPVQAKAADYSLFPAGGRQIVAALGLNVYTVASRLRRGWSFEDAITKPVEGRHASRYPGDARPHRAVAS